MVRRTDTAGAVDSTAVVGLDGANAATLGREVAVQLDEDDVVLNGTTLVETVDVEAANGIIHIIDSVIVPQDVEFPGTVVDALVSYPRFSNLVDAVVSANLLATLSDDEAEFTVFAPTNRAFAALGDISGLSADDLAAILTYHVVPGRVLAADVVNLTSATTVNTADISIDASAGVVLNGDVNVTFTDIETSNGVIHVIDAVLSVPDEE